MQEHLLNKRNKLRIIGFYDQEELYRIHLGYVLSDLQF